MYGKLFESMYDGTLYGNWQAIVTLQQLVIFADRDGVVDMTPQAISARTSIPLKIILAGLEHLERPDEYTRTPGADGKRIDRLDSHRPWGWLIVNYAKYREMSSAEDKRGADRERIAAKRAKEKQGCREMSQAVADVVATSQVVAEVAHADADAEVEASKNPLTPNGAHPGKGKARKKPELPIPDDFHFDEELQQYIRQRLPDVDITTFEEQFLGDALTKQWRYADWRLAAMRYVRNAMPNSGHFAAGQYPRVPKPQEHQWL